MIKLITSIVSCLLLSFVGTFVISKYSKENWIMDLSYDHIERQLDINYILLDNYLNLKLEEKFKNYISKLDSKITLKNNLNPCSKARGEKASPQLLTRYQDLRFQVTVVGKNKELILECEKFLDNSMRNFEKVNLMIAKKLLLYKESINNVKNNFNNNDDFLIKKKEAKELITKNLVDLIYESKQEKDKVKKSSPEYILKMDSLAKTLALFEFLNEDENFATFKLIDFDVMDLNLIKKISRDLSKKEENTILLFICIFFILQFIVTLIIFRKTLYSKKNTQKLKKLMVKINA
tara:strand:+ start:179 stop:1054 length:876 start_codon:yes stop_codon:yes gene_type:complete